MQKVCRLMPGWISDAWHDPAREILFLGSAFSVGRHL